MKHFLQKILTCMFVCVTCAFGAIDSANAYTFAVTTDSMCSGNNFYFTISASGNYTVSCEKGTLRSSNCSSSVSGSYINRSGNTTNCLYYCEFSKYSVFSSCNARTIEFTVNTTPSTYNTSAAAISFYAYGDISNTNDSSLSSNAAHIAGISGSLAQMFPYRGSSANQHPMFLQTFRGARNLTSVSASIFNGYSGNLQGASSMFAGTFYGCTNLTSIDYNLFSNITGGGSSMFYQTFYGCSKLNPSTPLRFQITSGQSEMFLQTFMGCTSLVNPPSFSNLSTGASYMFRQTFSGCSNLTSAPSSFFSSSNVSGQSSMFYGTFENCTKLKTLPSNLFSNITTAANNMFERTFYGCSGFNSNTYVPKTLFAGLTPRQSSYPTNMMQNIFGGSNNLATSCPSGMSQYPTGYESYWNSKVSCTTGYTVNYSCGSDGTGTPTDSNEYAYGATVTALTSSACTASNGYTFYGWYCSNSVGSVSSGGTFTMPSANTTCFARYTAIAYTVSFAQGAHGSGSMSSQTKYFGNTVTLPANSFTAANGYRFTGWNCNNGIGDKAVNETFTMPAAAVTCTAQWIPVYTVTYSCGSNGSGTRTDSNSPYIGGATVTALTSSACTASGYTFNGWSCGNGVGSVSSGGTFTMPSANTTCTAQWASNTVNLTWYGEDGETTLSGGASSCTYNGTISSLPTAPEKPGYHFTRWKIKPAACFIPSTLVDTGGSTIGCRNADGTYEYYSNSSVYQLTENSTWVVEWSNGEKVYGRGICSGQSGTNNDRTYSNPSTTTDESELTSASGEKKYCWCAATGYISNDGTQCSLTNTLWEFDYSTNVSSCANYCELNCANDVIRFSGFRSVLFGAGN